MGVPGAGKTTVSHAIHEATGAVHLWADQERQGMFDKITHSRRESDELYAALNQRTDELLAAGQSVIFDTNFNYRKDRDHLRSIAARHNAETFVIWLTTPLAVARDRALHEHHRDRNGYDHVMTEVQFQKLTDHLEAPRVHENFIKIDGTNIDIAALKRDLTI